MTCPTLLKMASQGGANALGHGDILGSVEEGKKADLILLNIDQPHITPSQNLVNTIVDAANGHDVTDSIINGKRSKMKIVKSPFPLMRSGSALKLKSI